MGVLPRNIARLVVWSRLWPLKFRQTARHNARTAADHTLGHTWVPPRPCSSVQPEACSYRYHYIAALAGIVRERLPGKRMVALAHSKEATEAHYSVLDLPGTLVDHEVVHRT